MPVKYKDYVTFKSIDISIGVYYIFKYTVCVLSWEIVMVIDISSLKFYYIVTRIIIVCYSMDRTKGKMPIGKCLWYTRI